LIRFLRLANKASECMRRLTKQFELSGQRCDTLIRLGAREVGLKCVQLVCGFRQPLECRSLLGRHWLVVGHRPLVRARIATVNPAGGFSYAPASPILCPPLSAIDCYCGKHQGDR
jgi:hypothetical protein